MTDDSRSKADEAERKIKQDAIDAAHELLKGHFDAIVILASWQIESGESACVSGCDGNWYAQNGMMSHVLTRRARMGEIEADENHRESKG